MRATTIMRIMRNHCHAHVASLAEPIQMFLVVRGHIEMRHPSVLTASHRNGCAG
ncbi:hypothetical protein KDAU_19240 [Dictyobacter aurantiacus]|uniref:Uncharacterized protein n=1 Tax=Dictyobacter aurantiacus TaxID=1936993 RepID=A0A401ZCL2_9CHLR|nr:hypothetical protein KDAU_19240 [Dictyobacter aurantiacus]